MRSSKSRSRSKSNRNRSVGNVVNRVFDSSGPEGKVRGTPQQIIDKYNQLARDAQLANDRVAAENFQQHAEHYLRMLAEAMREQAERQAQQQERQRNNQQQNNNQQQGQGQGGNGQSSGSNGKADPGEAEQPRVEQPAAQPAAAEPAANDALDVSGGDSALVDTPEDKAPRPRRRKKPAAQDEGAAVQTPPADAAE